MTPSPGSSSSHVPADHPGPAAAAPAIILVTPQMGENIGAAARAMLNCGLTDLRLVAPRDGWPNIKAERAAVGALELMPPVRVFDTVADSIADLTLVFASTARDRKMVKPIVTARQAAIEARGHIAAGGKVGVLFGPERTGLLSDDVSLANTLITVPLNPDFTSLNLGQAVLLVGYEWFQAGDATPASYMPLGGTVPATKEELNNFFAHLERELDACGFLRNEEARPSMIRNLRNMWQRAELTEQEVRTLHGMIKELTTLRVPRRK
jgi:tRNA/rRNA methyltransferase